MSICAQQSESSFERWGPGALLLLGGRKCETATDFAVVQSRLQNSTLRVREPEGITWWHVMCFEVLEASISREVFILDGGQQQRSIPGSPRRHFNGLEQAVVSKRGNESGRFNYQILSKEKQKKIMEQAMHELSIPIAKPCSVFQNLSRLTRAPRSLPSFNHLLVMNAYPNTSKPVPRLSNPNSNNRLPNEEGEEGEEYAWQH
ncbi:hypothetical protein B0J12DRAFT_698269 [Macrophomina phaseolina]|uniref:Uncharacterized protein n=1 Tax=Macrophomina phaseolina TaxID=35725 RepID=A0ABQ8GGJ1_9PEZI|nr:hypothetical protein B0J12DRAFT_698269 [Macrophomina phaseolina]